MGKVINNMKKKLFCLLLILILPILLLSGCDKKARYNTSELVAISYENIDMGSTIIFVHKKTKVMYLFVKKANGGGLTVMLDSDGKPLLYKGELYG